MKKFYYLSTCDTCKRILKELDPPAEVKLQDIKEFPLLEIDLELLAGLSGSHEALINKRARLYQQRGLKDKVLTEEEYKELLLEHYTFLKRPVLVLEDDIFIGNSKGTVEAAKTALKKAGSEQ